jgi:hypothetical protein
MRNAVATLLSLVLVSLAGWPAAAQEPLKVTGKDWSASIGANVWLSNAEIEWEHEFPTGIPGLNAGSKLHWRDIEAPIYSLEGELVWRRLVVIAAGGWGSVEDGTFIDDDFVSDGPLLSRTRSTVDDGSIYYGNVALGWRVVEWRDFEQRHGYLDLLAGYQWWREKYEAFGAASVIIPGDIPSNIKVITHDWTWQSIRIGGRASIPFPAGFGARVSAFFLPWSSVRLEDTHHLRTDLRQNPSSVTEATGGFGYQVEAALTYTFWRGLGAEAGYRRWQIDMDDGDVSTRAVDASLPKVGLREASIQRSGFFIGLFYRF